MPTTDEARPGPAAKRARTSRRRKTPLAKVSTTLAAGLPAKSVKRLSERSAAVASGYSQAASRLLSRGTQAIDDAYSWLGSAGAALPAAARRVPMPSQAQLRGAINDRPLLIGAVGLGLGALAGAMLLAAHVPSVRAAYAGAIGTSRRKGKEKTAKIAKKKSGAKRAAR